MMPVAVAGPDQVGQVGQWLVLDGSGSLPRGLVGARWMLLSGPAILESKEAEGRFSFVPAQPGIYRFALVVGCESRVSMPDLIEVTVNAAIPASSAASGRLNNEARWLHVALAAIPRGPETASQAADVFESIADRIPLYSTFAQLQSELTRRLDVVVPDDPSIRDAWARGVFQPLSREYATVLFIAGIDPTKSSAADVPLSDVQKEHLSHYYRGLADACRSGRD